MSKKVEKLLSDLGNAAEAGYADNMTNSTVQSFSSIEHVMGYNSYTNLLPNISTRDQFGRLDYEYFRPNEAIPRDYPKMIEAIDSVYCNLSIVRNVIDLMSDFASQGIRIVHPVPKIQRFFQAWFDKVHGFERSERFLSCLYRHGMITIDIGEGRLKRKSIQNMSKAGVGDSSATIPLEYTFLHPALIEEKNGRYYYRKPQIEGQMIPGPKAVPLKPENTYVEYFKKDDWKSKPTPFLLPIVKHAIMLDKLHLADSAALDGAISKIRVWKLGDPDNGIFPTPAAVNRLDTLLRSNVGGGSTDLIWGPDIQLIESNTDVVAFLGDEKYAPHLNQIYEGLGISGSFAGQGGGTTNNYITVKILMKRLRAGRACLSAFWQHEIDKVQKAMKIAKRATVEYDYFDVGDEESERRFLVDLVDRNIISEEKLHNIMGFNAELERSRVMKESKERDNKNRPSKASPYHDAMFEESLIKVSLTNGYITPAQLGIKPIDEYDKNDDITLEMQEDERKKAEAQVETKGGTGGRPQGAKDKQKRKSKEFTPKIKASFELWGSESQKKINETLKPALLNVFGKNTSRELTAKQVEISENIKFGVLSNIKPFTFPERDQLINLIKVGLDERIKSEFKILSSEISTELQRPLTLDELKQIQITVLMEKFYNENF